MSVGTKLRSLKFPEVEAEIVGREPNAAFFHLASTSYLGSGRFSARAIAEYWQVVA